MWHLIATHTERDGVSNTTGRSVWLNLAKAATEIPSNPTVILVALALTGLAASMVLAREATGDLQVEFASVWSYPPGVVRAPQPAILAPGALSCGS